MKRILFGLVLFFGFFKLLAQGKIVQDLSLSPKGLNHLVNAKLASLVSGQPSGTEVANFASFEPADGRFTFKGSVPLTKDPESSRFAFLSVRLEADLISESYAALFKNSVLNSGTVADLQLHYRFKKGIKGINYVATDEAGMLLKKALLKAEQGEALSKTSKGLWEQNFADQKDAKEFLFKLTQFKLSDNKNKQIGISQSLKTELAQPKIDATEVKKMSEELTKLERDGAELKVEEKRLKKSVDSLTFIEGDLSSFRLKEINEIKRKFIDTTDKLEQAAVATGVRFTWFTLVAGGSKKNYYTFNDQLVFSQQIAKRELSSFRIGISMNYYAERSFPKKVFYGNIGFLRYRDNNIKFLSTMDVLQDRTIKNVTGDTVRKISKKYSCYIDPIIESNISNIFANAYFVHSSKTSAFHLFPSIDLVDNAEDVASLGIGYVISFKSEKKEKPVINAEGYIKFIDLFNNLESKPRFWNRNEIGISFTLPFNFFIQ